MLHDDDDDDDDDDSLLNKALNSHELNFWFQHDLNQGFDLLCWGLMTRQPMWVNLCHLPEKGKR